MGGAYDAPGRYRCRVDGQDGRRVDRFAAPSCSPGRMVGGRGTGRLRRHLGACRGAARRLLPDPGRHQRARRAGRIDRASHDRRVRALRPERAAVRPGGRPAAGCWPRAAGRHRRDRSCHGRRRGVPLLRRVSRARVVVHRQRPRDRCHGGLHRADGLSAAQRPRSDPRGGSLVRLGLGGPRDDRRDRHDRMGARARRGRLRRPAPAWLQHRGRRLVGVGRGGAAGRTGP